MMTITHMVLSIAGSSLMLGTTDPLMLGTAAIASLLPDIDTSHSTMGRLLPHISRRLEQRFPHRTITHSFLGSGVVALLTLPVAFSKREYWVAIVLGYFLGWFGDVFTKQGVAAFYPNASRLIIPGNPNLRLSTGSQAEVLILALLLGVAIVSININNNGGILRSFNQVLGIPSGAVEIASAEVSQYLLFATIKGRFAVTQQPVDDTFEVIRPLTQTDMLIKDKESRTYRVGTTQECQIIASRILLQRGQTIRSTVREVELRESLLDEAIADSPRTYINGTLILHDAEDLIIPTHADRFDTITLQPGRENGIVRLESASPAEVINLIGGYYASGNLIIRIVEVR